MIVEWRLSNFKSVRDDTRLSISPLTIFAGANSSGKSSMIQSMLLIAQSLTSPMTTKSVLLNGPLVRLGTFDDVRSFNGDDSISIGWTSIGNLSTNARVPQSARFIEAGCDIKIGVSRSPDITKLSQLSPHIVSSVLRSGRSQDSFEESAIRTERVERVFNAHSPRFEGDDNPWGQQDGLNYSVSPDSATKHIIEESFTDSTIVGCYYQHFVPAGLFLRVDRVEYLTSAYVDVDKNPPEVAPRLDLVDPFLIQHVYSELSEEELQGLGLISPRLTASSHQTLFHWRNAL